MTEAQFSRRLTKTLRYKIGRRGVVYKINDRSTGGIPDCAIVIDGVTTWAEIKLTATLTRLQEENLKLIQRACSLYWNIDRTWSIDCYGPSRQIYSGEGFENLVYQLMILCEAK